MNLRVVLVVDLNPKGIINYVNSKGLKKLEIGSQSMKVKRRYNE